MKKRTKCFFGVLATLAVVGVVFNGGNNGSGLIKMALVFLALWMMWRVFVFVSLLLRPLRQVIKPYADPLNRHFDDTLRRSGLGAVADVGSKIQSGLDRAVEATQARSKK